MKWKDYRKNCIILTVFLAMSASVNQAFGDSRSYVSSGCYNDQITIPKTPFRFEVFCEGAIGNYLSVTFQRLMDGYTFPWQPYARHWQEEPWTSDITSVFFSDGISQLLVSTSDIYGTGKIYYLDLIKKKSTEVKTKKKLLEDERFVISEVDWKKKKGFGFYDNDPKQKNKFEFYW